MSEENFASIKEGDRFRIINLQTSQAKIFFDLQNMAHLSVSKSSKIINVNKKYPDLVEK